MADTLRPEDPAQVREAVAWALATETPIEIAGGGTKAALGRPLQTGHRLDLSALSGVDLYEPAELVLRAGAGTTVAEITKLLAENRQHLAFEPADYRALLGSEDEGEPTLGGIIGCNLAGPRRIKLGAARDHFLGFEGVNGRGEAIKSGGRVVKNVTGYDLCKLLAGSYGTLAALTRITVKVLPAPEKTRTVLVFGLADGAAAAVMATALGSPQDVSGAAHLPAATAARSAVSYVRDAGAAVTALRLEGPGPSVVDRCATLRILCAEAVGPGAVIEELHGHNSQIFWREVRDVRLLAAGDAPVWRVSVAPMAGPGVVAALAERMPVAAVYDWGGGLVWLALPEGGGGDAGAAAVRGALPAGGGHATLVRASAPVRAAVPVFQLQPTPLAALSARVKASFDPRAILNPGRMYAGV